ncbi:MAG: phosphoribosyltransferase [Acidimicrobiales bacterium]
MGFKDRALGFKDRGEAGRLLGRRLRPLHLESPLVLGLPRGGVPVAAEVAAQLGAPLDVFVARKVGMPGHEELGVGAVAEGLSQPILSPMAGEVGVEPRHLAALAEAARQEVVRRATRYRGGHPLPELAGRDVVLVDDGLATGVTAEAALAALRRRRPNRLVLAVPVCAPEAAARLAGVADDVVCVQAPAEFFAVGLWYENFSQTTDEEVIEALHRDRPGVGHQRR